MRLRLGWRQRDVARAAGVSQALVSRVERGALDGISWRAIRRFAEALGLSAEIYVRWRGGELDRLLDADHAALQAWCKRHLEALGWVTVVEATFSEYGERGSVDLLAFHPVTRVLLVVEIKTVVADVQGTLRPIDVKLRLAPILARRRGWRPAAVVPLLLLADRRTNRRRLAAHEPLFARFALRAGDARAWLREPSGVTGLLMFRIVTGSTGVSAGQAGRQRVRRRRGPSSVDGPQSTPRPAAESGSHL